MPKRSPENQEIVRLLGRLKEGTPEYPVDLLEERKYSFLKQVVDLKISGEGRPPDERTGGQGSSNVPKGALGGGATLLGMSLKMALAIGAVILLLAAAVLFRERIVEFLAQNELTPTQEIAPPLFGSTPTGPARGTPTPVTTPGFEPAPGGAATGEAPGTPAQGGPGNIFEYLLCILQSGADSCR